MHPPYWNAAKKHLSARCPTMRRLIAQYQSERLRARGDGFYTLLRSVVGQQISVKAADAVWAKVEKVVKPLTPKKLLSLSDEKLRTCGLSASKVAYAKNVAVFYTTRGVEAEFWKNHSDEEVLAELTSIKGIGTWTAEMFLIFHLMRPDVFPVKDLGVLKAIHVHYLEGRHHKPQPPKSPAKPTKKAKNQAKMAPAPKAEKWLKPSEYQEIAAAWQPYRTVATWYLWRALDPVAVEY